MSRTTTTTTMYISCNRTIVQSRDMFLTRFAYDNSSLSVIAYIKYKNKSLFIERIIAYIKQQLNSFFSSSSSSSYLFVRHFDACPLHLHLPPTAKSATE